MRKTILIIFALCTTAAYSQRVSIGPKVGVSISNLSGTDKSSSLVGITGGGFFIYSIVEHFGVSADLLYSAEGAKYSTVVNAGSLIVSTDAKLKLSYIRVPLLANVFFGSLGDRLRPKISLGPSFGFLMSADNTATITTVDAGTLISTESFKSTSKTGYSKFDFSAIIGAGLNYKVGEKTWLNLDARYSIGATDIKEVKVEGADPVKNNSFAITLGLAFGLSKE